MKEKREKKLGVNCYTSRYCYKIWRNWNKSVHDSNQTVNWQLLYREPLQPKETDSRHHKLLNQYKLFTYFIAQSLIIFFIFCAANFVLQVTRLIDPHSQLWNRKELQPPPSSPIITFVLLKLNLLMHKCDYKVLILLNA